MGCRLGIRLFGWWMAMLIVAAQTGCAGGEEGRPPAEVLSVASAGLEGVDRYTFRSRSSVRYEGMELQELESYEGEIAGHAVRMIRGLSGGSAWPADASSTPSAVLAGLAGRNARVEYAGEAPEGCVALRVTLSGEAAEEEVRARLTRQFEQAALQAESGLEGGKPAAGKGTDDYRRALADEKARFKAELDRLLDGLEAEKTALVTIDRKTMLPLAIEETTVLRYEAGGRTRTEEWVTRTTLGGFDGSPSAP